MPTKHFVKRNSLSSKWGVWTTDSDSVSPVENLVAELKTEEGAESYIARLEAGEAHEEILESLNAKKPRKSGAGFFSRLLKRGSAAAEITEEEAPVQNRVIEIETAENRSENEDSPAAALEDEVASAVEAPSRFEVIEQPAPARPAPTAEPPARPVEQRRDVVEVDAFEVSEAPEKAPVAETPVSGPAEQPDRGVLVDWTFTPPPDLTPDELHGQPVPVVASASQPAQPRETGETTVSENRDTGRITVDVCVTKSMQDMSSGDPRISDKKYNSIASKEYTEVNKAFNAGNPENLREELNHLAAVCLAWADAIEQRAAGQPGTRAA